VKAAIVGVLVGTAIGAVVSLWSCTVDRKTEALACTTQAQCTPMGRACEQGYCVIDPNAKFDAAIDAYIPDAPVCPPSCNDGCMFGATATCMMHGTGSGDLKCPSGFHCTITCASSGSCGVIDCSAAATCNVMCMADQACGNVTCGASICTVACATTGSAGSACGDISSTGGSCDATCTGSGACGAIMCTGNSACSANCSGGSAACGALACGTGKCTETCTGSGACGNLSCASSCNCNSTCNPIGACATMACPHPGNKYCAVGGTGNPCDSSVFPQCKSCP
jgi:hypothetical protein